MKLASRIFKRDNWYVTSEFGYRDSIKTSAGTTDTFHNGCDYGTHGEKWKQYALEKGTVISAGTDSYGGKFAWVKYPRLNIKLLHYHLDSVKVKAGQSVNSDTVIGTTGMTGMATGIHLHLGMKYLNSNEYVDPHKYDYKEEEKTNTTLKYKVGDVVTIDGVYISSTSDTKLTPAITKGKITKVLIGKRNPYLLNDGNIGWVNDSCIVSCENVSNTYYIVQKGDTLSGIAKKHNTTVHNVYNANKTLIDSENKKRGVATSKMWVYPGQKLVIK